jgi:multiple sugar transport system substrate-binding protein
MDYAQEEWLAPLDERMENSDSPILDEWTPVQSACEYQGSTYCATILGYGYVLGWNEAAFEEAGLDGPPQNSDELLEAARELTVDRDGDGTIDQYGFVFPTVTHAGVYVTATQFIFEHAPDAHWLTADGELNREAITYAWSIMRQLIEDGSVPEGLDNNGKRQFWVEGRAAMMIEGPWIQGRIDSADDDIRPHLNVAHPPVDGAPYGGASNVLAIPAGIDEDRQQLAWEFIELFTTEEWQAKYATIAGQPPARAGVLEEAFLDEEPNMRQYVDAAESARNYLVPGVEEEFTRFRDLAIEATLAVVVQGQDPDAALDQLDRQTSSLR